MPDEIVPSINRLPPENLGEIFFLVQYAITLRLSNKPLGYPWSLALVCKLWRDVVFSTPQLWATMSIDLMSAHATTPCKFVIKALGICLERSKGYPLKIFITPFGYDMLEFVSSFMKPLVEHSARWQEVVFGFSVDRLAHYLSNPKLQYTQLSSLTLYGSGTSTQRRVPPIFRGTPSLTSLRLYDLPNSSTFLKISWSQITDFTCGIGTGGINGLFNQLRLMPNLVSLSISGTPDGSSAHHVKDFELPHLRNLTWTTATNLISPFLNSVRVPRLTEIKFHNSTSSWGFPVDNFTHKSQSSVTSVIFSGIHANIVSSLLRIFPETEQMTFSNNELDEGLVRNLTFSGPQNQWLVPKIKRMIFDGTRIPENLRVEFAVMLESRLQIAEDSSGHGRKLNSFHIICERWSHSRRNECSAFSAMFQDIKGRLSPQHRAVITYEERCLI